jgi:acetyl esterase/lipase
MDRRAFLSLGGASIAALAIPGWAQVSSDPQWFGLLDPDLMPTAREMLRDAAAGKARPQRPAVIPDGVLERRVPGAKGAPEVPVFILNAGPRPAGPRGAILHIHGGGYVGGNARQGLVGLKARAEKLDCVIVTVEYRLAPATPFPGSLEDNYAALKWLHANAATLGVDPSRIVVMGESAGGGHAAMLAIAARDRGEVPVAFQALIYPMLDDRTGSTRPAPPQVGHLIWTEKQNRNGWGALLGQPAGQAKVPYGAVPARVENLKGLPPAFIVVGSLDLFAEEDIEYARRLVAAGVPTDMLLVSGGFHASEAIVPEARSSVRFNAGVEEALRGALAKR